MRVGCMAWRIGRRVVLCLELYPDRATPDQLLESRRRLLALLDAPSRH